MSWVEEQSWFGMEDLVIDRLDPHEEILCGNWVTKYGDCIPLKEMTDKHLANAIKMIEDGRLNRKWALPFLKGEQKRRKRQAFIDNFFDDLLKGAQESAEEPPPIVNGTLHN